MDMRERLELAIGAAVRMRAEILIEVSRDGAVELYFKPCRESPRFSWRPAGEIAEQNKRLLAAARSLGKCVYFFECVGRVKIGVANDVADRLKKLQTGCPYPITIAGVMAGGAAEERHLHDLFSDHHVQLEWFVFAPQIQKFVLENCTV